MTDDKIAEIRARHAQSEKNYIELEATWKAQVHEDRATLLAEVERLRAENDEKQALIDAARAHRNNLRAEIERTHALLKDPNAVAINMLRGVIALPSADQIRHIYQQTPEDKP